MEPGNRFARYILGSALILLAILGIYIAYRIHWQEVIAKGVLGLVVLYLQFFYIRFSGIDASMDKMLSDSKVHKYLIYAFIGPGIAYLAGWYILDMLSLAAGTLVELLK
jgi:hypothetical protein